MECSHTTTKKKKVTRTVGEHTFTYATEVCENCGTSKWDSSVDAKFKIWLSKLDEESFKVQKIQIPTNVYDFLERESLNLSGKKNVSAMVRAATAVFCNLVLPNHELSAEVEEEFESKKHLVKEDAKSVGVRFVPLFYVKVKAQADLADMSIAKFVQAAVLRISSVLMNERDYKDIKKQVQEYLLAAA